MTNQVATDWWSISAISSGCAKQVKLEKNQCEGTQKTINNRSNEWLTLFACLFCHQLHSLEHRTKTDCNVKQKLNWSNFYYFATFHFFCILGASTIIDTIVQMWSRGARLRGHFLQRRPSTPRLGLRACIVSRFGCDSRNRGGDLGLGGWLGELGIWGRKRGGAATWLDLPALCSDLSTIPRLGEQWLGGRKELRMRTRPNWLLDTCPNQWGLNDESDDFFLPMTTNHIQLLSVRLTIHILDEDQDGRAEKCPQERLHRLDGDHGFYWIVIKRKCGGGKKGRKSVRMFGRWILKLH